MAKASSKTMTVKEAAGIWECSTSTVKKYLREGMVPLAEQAGKFKAWSIPRGIQKPQCSRHQAVVLMSYIGVYACGSKPDLSKLGITYELYKYISDMGFITKLPKPNSKNFGKKLMKARITTIGEKLIREENDDLQRKGKTIIDCSGSLSLGVLRVEAGIKHETA